MPVTEEPEAPIRGATPWQREVRLAAGLLVFGLLALPFGVYVVGQRLLGNYGEGGGGGALALAETIWRDLFSLRVPAWILVLSPYLIVQLGRAVLRLWRRTL